MRRISYNCVRLLSPLFRRFMLVMRPNTDRAKLARLCIFPSNLKRYPIALLLVYTDQVNLYHTITMREAFHQLTVTSDTTRSQRDPIRFDFSREDPPQWSCYHYSLPCCSRANMSLLSLIHLRLNVTTKAIEPVTTAGQGRLT